MYKSTINPDEIIINTYYASLQSSYIVPGVNPALVMFFLIARHGILFEFFFSLILS